MPHALQQNIPIRDRERARSATTHRENMHSFLVRKLEGYTKGNKMKK